MNYQYPLMNIQSETESQRRSTLFHHDHALNARLGQVIHIDRLTVNKNEYDRFILQNEQPPQPPSGSQQALAQSMANLFTSMFGVPVSSAVNPNAETTGTEAPSATSTSAESPTEAVDTKDDKDEKEEKRDKDDEDEDDDTVSDVELEEDVVTNTTSGADTTVGATLPPMINGFTMSYSLTNPSGDTIRLSTSGSGLPPGMSSNGVSGMFPSIFSGLSGNLHNNIARMMMELINGGSLDTDTRVPLTENSFEVMKKGLYKDIKADFESNGIEYDSTCVICQENYEDEDEITNIGCSGNHIFHTDCIRPWLTRVSKTCPVCREDLPESTDSGEDGNEATTQPSGGESKEAEDHTDEDKN